MNTLKDLVDDSSSYSSMEDYSQDRSVPYVIDSPTLLVPEIVQPLDHPYVCWAVGSAIMDSWKHNISQDIHSVMEKADKNSEYNSFFTELFSNDKMINGNELNSLLDSLGLIGEPPFNFTSDKLIDILKKNSPIWAIIGVSEQNGISHSVIIDGAEGITPDPTGENTILHYYDPWKANWESGGRDSMTFSDFIELIERVPNQGLLHSQIIHY
jgi:hypothetical protein